MFDIGNLILGVAATLIPFYWVFKLKEFNARVYFASIVFFLFIYSGAGVGLIGVHNSYWIYYLAYTASVSIGVFCSKWNNKSNVREKTSFKLTSLINKYGNTIIIIFILLNFATLLYPEFLLHRIINPPRPDLSSNFALKFMDINETFYEKALYYIIQLITPFFFLALFKYRSKLIKFSVLLIIQPYVTYCKDGYIGRGSMILYLFVIVVAMYKYKPKFRKVLIPVVLIFIPSFIIFIVGYASIRLGSDADNIGALSAIEQLVHDETSYPLWFSTIYNNPFNINSFINYIIWFFTLPLPGFLKGGHSPQGLAISELLLGVGRNQRGFYILLPGIVGESVYHFGKYFFWCHGILMGFLIGKVYKFLNKYKQFSILLIYTTFQVSYMMNRGGTASSYSFILKHLVYFCIIIYIYTHYTSSKVHYAKTKN